MMAVAIRPKMFAFIAVFMPLMPLVDRAVAVANAFCPRVTAATAPRHVTNAAAAIPTAVASPLTSPWLSSTQPMKSSSFCAPDSRAGISASTSFVAIGCRAVSPFCLSSWKDSPIVRVSSDTPRIVSVVAPVAAMKSSTERVPVLTASTNWAAPRVPNRSAARFIAPASSPEAMKSSMLVMVSCRASGASRPSSANSAMARESRCRVPSASSPALSICPTRAAESCMVKPNPRSCGPALAAELASSVTVRPVACETWNSSSRAAGMSAASMPKPFIALETASMSASIPRFDRATICPVMVSSGSSVSPSLVLRSARVSEIWDIPPSMAGTVSMTDSADSLSPSKASPLAPVPTRMVRKASSNSTPMATRAPPAAAASPPTARADLSRVLPNSFAEASAFSIDSDDSSTASVRSSCTAFWLSEADSTPSVAVCSSPFFLDRVFSASTTPLAAVSDCLRAVSTWRSAVAASLESSP